MVTHTYTTANESGYVVTLRVIDDENNEAQISKTAVVADDTDDDDDDDDSEIVNEAPVAAFVINTNGAPVTEGNLVQFDAAGSQDPEGGVLHYRWNFGDGSPVEAGFGVGFQVRSHRYAEPGTYTVTLTVTDDENASDDFRLDVVVVSALGNRPPEPVLADGPRVGPAPFTVQLNGQLSFDPDGDSLDFTFEFSGGDGSENEIIEGAAVVTKTFDAEGVYKVVMSVDDRKVAPADIPSIEAEIRVTSAITGTEPPPGTDVPDDEPSAGSHTQRTTGSFCGLGMLPAFFASLLGLGMLRFGRRRF